MLNALWDVLNAIELYFDIWGNVPVKYHNRIIKGSVIIKRSDIINKWWKQQRGHSHWNKKGPLEAVGKLNSIDKPKIISDPCMVLYYLVAEPFSRNFEICGGVNIFQFFLWYEGGVHLFLFCLCSWRTCQNEFDVGSTESKLYLKVY